MYITSVSAVVTWLRDDLRLDDNPALADAAATGLPVVVLYVWSPVQLGDEAPRGAAAWWLHNALADLDAQLRRIGSELVVQSGDAGECLRRVMDDCGARDVFWNRRYTPYAVQLDGEIERSLRADGYNVHIGAASLLREPWDVLHDGMPYKVFTAYHKATRRIQSRRPVATVTELNRTVLRHVRTVPLEGLGLATDANRATNLAKVWVPTAAGCNALLQNMLRIVPDYYEERDFTWKAQTSRLSPYLRFGQVSPARIVRELDALPDGPGKTCFLKELHWREFAYHEIAHFKDLPREPLDAAFADMPWRADAAGLKAWNEGRTGFPIVDAGMRQLAREGWMHNRVRMIAGSFLVKDLLSDWRGGASWFLESLVDADIASNSLNWQWVAGCGPDASPFIRIFNPLLQARKFDPDGFYVRKYVPELAYMPNEWIHTPWKAPRAILEEADVVPGVNYPDPLVDHDFVRRRALEAFAKARGNRASKGVHA